MFDLSTKGLIGSFVKYKYILELHDAFQADTPCIGYQISQEFQNTTFSTIQMLITVLEIAHDKAELQRRARRQTFVSLTGPQIKQKCLKSIAANIIEGLISELEFGVISILIFDNFNCVILPMTPCNRQ